MLFVGWVLLLVQELMRDSRVTTQEGMQGVVLTVVFLGYVVGWQKELAGALIALFGTVMFFVVCGLGFGKLPGLAAAWFALPSVLYILAWYTSKKYTKMVL
ncbi:MAG TPA: hypothetical protein VHK01_11780 [Lacipirellulaceae bacterium]|nr:hypothetical protein [Lacipirellulaceae bacterium]